jgi:sulfotransferase family protein
VNARNIIFICGFPSSGTDLLKNVLNAHAEIHIGGEFPLLPSLATRRSPTVSSDELAAVARDIIGCDVHGNLERSQLPADLEGPCSFADVYVALLTSKQATWYGNKTPQNSENVDKLEQLFPGARYVLIVRDVRDVALSWRKKWGKDMLLCAHRWMQRMQRAIDLLESVARDRYVVVSYEDLLQDHRAVALRICSFLGVPYDSNIDDFHEHIAEIVPGKLNYGQPVIAANRNKWRREMTDATLGRLEEIAYPALQRFGYPSAIGPGFRPITVAEKMTGRVRDTLAMLFVGNRALEEARLHTWRSIKLELAKRFGRYRF